MSQHPTEFRYCMDTGFCVDCLEKAIMTYGEHEIFNSEYKVMFSLSGYNERLNFIFYK